MGTRWNIVLAYFLRSFDYIDTEYVCGVGGSGTSKVGDHDEAGGFAHGDGEDCEVAKSVDAHITCVCVGGGECGVGRLIVCVFREVNNN